MKKHIFFPSLVAALTFLGGNVVEAQNRPLQQHHQRFKQRMGIPQYPNPRAEVMPYYGEVAKPESTVVPTPSSPENTVTSPNDQAVSPEQSSNESSTDVAGARVNPNSFIDNRGLAANDRTRGVLSGPLQTIGDFFTPGGSGIGWDDYFYPGYETSMIFGDAAPGSQLGRTKLTEQNSPLPRDRFFFDYSLFHNTTISDPSLDVQRFAPGFERTFLDRLCSIEMRVPMGVTLSSSQTLLGAQDDDTEFGNMAFALKGLLLSTNDFALAVGLGVQTPTAEDNVIRYPIGAEALRVKNQQARILPYIATLHTSGDWFWQNYVQVDVAANGNEVLEGGQHAGVLQQQNFIYVDSSLSRWIYRNYRSRRGLALTGEVHYNRTLGEADTFTAGSFTLGTPGFEADVVNLTFGSTYVINKTTITAAYGTPVTEDRGFDGEFRILLNRFF